MPSPRLWLHHAAGEGDGPAAVRAIQSFHMDVRGWSDIAYSFLVDDDGAVYEGRGAGRRGAHTEGDNSGSHAICAMGNFSERPPSPAMERSIVQLAAHGHGAGWWGPRITGGHRDAPGAETACPGARLYLRIRSLNKAIADELEEETLTEELRQYLDAMKAQLMSEIDAVQEAVAGRTPGDATKPSLIGRIARKVGAQP